MKAVIGIVIAIIVIWVGYTLLAPGGEEGPIRIGAILPLTGDAAAYGEPGRNMLQLAADEINAAGGINGRNLEFIFEDGKCVGKDAANAIQKLANVDKVEAIIGGFCSGESLSAVPIATQAKVLLFSPGSSNPGLTNSSPYFFRNYPSDAAQGTVLANVADSKGWGKVAVVQEQTDYAAGLYKAFNARFTELGNTDTKEEFASDTSDFRSIITKVRAGNPDALFVIVQTPAVASRIFKQMTELNWKPNLLVSDIIPGDPNLVAENKALLEGAFAAEFGTNPENPKFKAMVEAYRAKYGEEPPFQAYAQTEYDSVYILADGIRAVGYDGEKLAAWSRTIENWQGAAGSVTIGEDGDPTTGHVPKIIRNGVVEFYQ
ncbi:MAG: ABC transporter substrate-binding protein [Candidatus Brennerbacteria bacterium]|nr:ABC transporter substrate-binding protein [Candidatus Brennerbacteria bacterium]